MRIVVLASGSKGNATLFEGARGTRILVDAGLSARGLKRRLLALREPNRLDAIVITHAHRDHVGHCEHVAAQYGVPLYMSEATERATRIEGVRVFSPREPFMIGNVFLRPTPLPHDAAQVALTLTDGEMKVGLCTDLGEVPGTLPQVLAGCDVLLLESNHELSLLREGPYPDFLKRRVASAGGHLSNAQTAELLREIAPTLGRVVLMHLSEANNHPDLALAYAKEAVGKHPVELMVAAQDRPFIIEPKARRVMPLLKSAQMAFAF